jgi:hypothetical protein
MLEAIAAGPGLPAPNEAAPQNPESEESETPAPGQVQPIETLESVPPPVPPLELIPLPPTANPAALDIVTSGTISQTGLTVPSLWWARELVGGKLVENWVAYPRNEENVGFVDLIVNRQLWSLLDYLERYQALNHFGQVASDYRYNIRVFNRQRTLLGTYSCQFELEPLVCDLWLDSPGLENGSELFSTP